DCGACGGGRGGPNARAFALMANDPQVRESLGIPKDTIFVGAYHNTCNDLIEYYDVDRVPASHAADLALAQKALDQAAALSAQERSRRFDNVPLDVSPLDALKAMADRTEDLAQVRPEYGHATNAVAVVGRRSLTRGLFMDRRSFLASYDPETDGDGTVLTRVLSAVGPVCAGINLEYYFSFTDRAGYGCGTKLPHNITGMLGVMDGHASDLRTGLPWQMVEIHEPVRLLLVVESPLSRLQAALSRLPALDRLVKNRWIQLAALEPGTKEIHLFRDGRFEPYQPESQELPQIPSSVQWYRGKRGHLGYAGIAS
ncbi:MAG TPA: putative inorganic carbon transporter subunit DabA, partial [bacterium]|nr:putative inorganic carbon transporter subunit DabA [bacterium]